jgi:hypothetical protein
MGDEYKQTKRHNDQGEKNKQTKKKKDKTIKISKKKN